MAPSDLNIVISGLFRTEYGKMLSVLTRLLGFQNLETAEDLAQETLLQAMKTWPFAGIPENPAAWIHVVAKRKALDVIRKNQSQKKLQQELSLLLSSEYTLAPTVNQHFLESEIEDSQLRMIFALCHPSLAYESRIALTLKTLCGLSVAEIAKSFLTSEETITKRLFRAREKIRDANILTEVPVASALVPRLSAVQHTLYLLFNEGYNSSSSDELIREELCGEAIRLALVLTTNHNTNTPETKALLALMCLQAAREDARLDSEKSIILLKDQDRSKWNQALIRKGMYFLDSATADNSVSEYHIEAAIAGYHTLAESFEKTDWKKIAVLYEALEKFKSHPFVELNKAIANGFAYGAGFGIQSLLTIRGLEQSHHYHAALGDFYVAEEKFAEACIAYQNALTCVTSHPEKELLQKKQSSIGE